MSDRAVEPEMTVSFQVAYAGSDTHSMDVQALAPALLGFAEVIREANHVLNGDRVSVNLRVISDFEHKCFQINLDLIMHLYDQMKTFLKLDDVVVAHDLLQWLEILGVPTGAFGLLGYLKIRKGRPIKNVTTLSSPDTRGKVSIEFGDDATPHHIEVHNHVYQLGENKTVLRAVSKTLEPIKPGNEFDRLEFKEQDQIRNTVNRRDAADIQKTCDLVEAQPEPSKPQTIEAVLQVYSPVYDQSTQNWRFLYGEQSITADISQTDIATRAIARGGVAVGEAYKVKLEISQHVTPHRPDKQ